MEQKVGSHKVKKPLRRAWFIVGLVVAVLLVGAGIALGVIVAKRPDPLVVEQSFKSYVESMATSGKIVLVEARQRLTVTETTPGLLFGDNAVGRFLGIRSDATVSASAWADLSFCIDLYAIEPWSLQYDPSNGGTLRFAAPPLSMMTPALHSDTIEIATLDRSILLDEQKLETQAMRGLTARFVEAASAMIDDPELRAKASDALAALLRAFAAQGAIPVERVDIDFAPAGN
ncbi:MAG TPA: hypothetical protein VMX33_04055 [bacterium]|nr:hypothetical protein [bacterium]